MFSKNKLTKRAAIEFETVIILLIVLIAFVVIVMMVSKYGGSLLHSLGDSVSNTVSISNGSITKLPGQ